jgi:hypothetical protein
MIKTHTTNYYDTFIEIAEDSPVGFGEVPLAKKDKHTVASMQYDIISKNPYKYTSDDVLFKVFALKNDLTESELEEARKAFFSKGQPCFRASPLTKRYGFGLFSDKEGKIAIYGAETKEYETFLNDNLVKKVKAMRSTKK